ncbi:hypothetical protein C0Q63_22300 [Streptomyces albidoflavus]|nr:hypothetical protein C0Q63_22300 [Streptomyces albidoflavus]
MGDGIGGETVFVAPRQAGGDTVVQVVTADDGDEARTLENAVCLGVAATGADLVGVRVAADVQEAVGAGQGDASLGEMGGDAPRRCLGRDSGTGLGQSSCRGVQLDLGREGCG